jgi:hypothetical protein
MTHKQLSEAVAVARSDADLNIEDLSIFDGYGLPDFQPVTCTIEALAILIRWDCMWFNGQIDQEALNQIAKLGRHRFHVCDAQADPGVPEGKAVA